MRRVAMAACAAAMACGSIATAEAAIVSVFASAETISDRSGQAQFTFDTSGKSFGSGSLFLDEYLGNALVGYDFFSDHVSANVTKGSCGKGCGFAELSVTFGDFTFDTSPEGLPYPFGAKPKDFSFNISISQRFGSREGATYTTVSVYDVLGDLSSSTDFSAVPLPSSVLHFGAALIALAGVGYTRRRIAAA